MIAVVYSGSRFADWKLADKGKILADFRTTGFNPFFNDEKYITHFLNKNVQLINYAEKIRKVYFFGAGASSKDRKEIVTNALGSFFRYSKVTVEHDLLAAALAALGDHKGIVGILGSGSNAAYFNSKKIEENNFGLGYILGDEGSANWLGKQLLKAFITDELPDDIRAKFIKAYDIDRSQILEKVYRQSQPALFLSSFSDFLIENRNDKFVKQLVTGGFDKYFGIYITPLLNSHPREEVHITGTIAAGFEDYLREAADKNQITISSVIKEPIYNLLKYYSNKN